MTPSPAAVIFDFDGVVVDSIAPDLLACTQLFRDYGRELPHRMWARDVCGQPGGYEYLFDLLLADPAVECRRDDLRLRLKQLWETYLTAEHVHLLPGVPALVAALRAAGVPIAVASSSERSWVMRWLDRHDLSRSFTAVVTREDVRHTKPDPEVYLTAAGRLGVPPAGCVAVEDSLVGIAAARAAGMRVVAVPTATTRFLDHTSADAVVDDLSAVDPAWLSRLPAAVR